MPVKNKLKSSPEQTGIAVKSVFDFSKSVPMVKQEMARFGLKQKDIVFSSGVSKQVVSNFLKGHILKNSPAQNS